jgi:ribosomal protein S18 acetylase RimI-like enzyme
MTGHDDHVLDNAGWHALTHAHAEFADGDAWARRYRPDVSVFHAMPGNDAASWRALAGLTADNGTAVLFRGVPIEVPDEWSTLFAGHGFQMVLDHEARVPELPTVDPATGAAVSMRALGDDDVEEMTALVAQTEPGPFQPRTIDLGGYVGVFHDDVLVAMAGQRMRPPGHCEISAVCTHPDARRRGYASVVTLAVAAAVQARGETAFLHVTDHNDSARVVYEQLGFRHRRQVSFAVVRRPRTG